MKNKKAELESGEPIIIWAVVIVVVLLVAFFLFRTRIDSWIKNLPDYQRNDGEDIEIVPGEVQIAICPDGYEEVGRFESGTSNSFFHIKDGNRYKKTSIEWLTGQNKIIVDKFGWFRELNLGPNIPSGPHQRKIEVDNSVFTRGSSKFVEVLKKELEKGDELFKILILLDNSVIKGLGGPNYVCQKKEVWDNLDKKLNLIYWGVEEPKIIDLRGETTTLIDKNRKTANGFLPIDLSSQIKGINKRIEYFEANGRISFIENLGLYLKEENNVFTVFLATKDKYSKNNEMLMRPIGEISLDGRLIFYCNDSGKLKEQEFTFYSIETGKVRMPDKAIFDYNPPWSYGNEGYPLRCNTTIILSTSAIYLAFHSTQNFDYQKYLSEIQGYSSIRNKVPEKIEVK